MILDLLAGIGLMIMTTLGISGFIIYVVSKDRYFFDLTVGFYMITILLILAMK